MAPIPLSEVSKLVESKDFSDLLEKLIDVAEKKNLYIDALIIEGVEIQLAYGKSKYAKEYRSRLALS